MPPLAPPDPPLADGDLSLRPVEPRDRAAIVAAIDGDPEIARWLPEIPQPYRPADADAYVEQAQRGWADGDYLRFVIDLDGRAAGQIGLRLEWENRASEIGYWVAAWARGRGAATRATRLLTEWAFGLGFDRVQIRALVGNLASLRVAEVAGFQREGVLRATRRHPVDDSRLDFVVLSRLRGD